MLRIAEIFYSIQGEGLDIGVPALFIRLAGCNLRCAWCDTADALDEDGGTPMDVSAILAELADFPCTFVVLTGGEPLLQDIAPLVRALADAGYTIAVETNGTLLNQELFTYVTTWAISPKLPSSGMAYDDAVIAQYAAHGNVFFKFVIADDADFAEVVALHERHRFTSLVFQPEGSTGIDGYRSLAERIKKEKKRFGDAAVRVLPQLHKLARIP